MIKKNSDAWVWQYFVGTLHLYIFYFSMFLLKRSYAGAFIINYPINEITIVDY